MKPLAFIDTETTSLRADRRAWEIGLILRRPGVADAEHHWFVDWNCLELGNADPFALSVGRFYERHPDAVASAFLEPNPWDERGVWEEQIALLQVEELTRGATLLGSNPSFDAELLAARMRENGICPSWHYHLVDVPTLALGWLHGSGRPIPEPAKSDDISLACGVDTANYERHSALGDCRWIRDLHDNVTLRPHLPLMPQAAEEGLA